MFVLSARNRCTLAAALLTISMVALHLIAVSERDHQRLWAAEAAAPVNLNQQPPASAIGTKQQIPLASVNSKQETAGSLLLLPATQQLPSSFPQASSREIEKQIVDKILGEGYDKRIRPAGSGNASKPGE